MLKVVLLTLALVGLSVAARTGNAGAPPPKPLDLASLEGAGTEAGYVVAVVVKRQFKQSVFGQEAGTVLTLEDPLGRRVSAFAGPNARVIPVAIGRRYRFEGTVTSGLFAITAIKPADGLHTPKLVTARVRKGWGLVQSGEEVRRIPAPDVPDGVHRLELVGSLYEGTLQLPGE